MAQAESSPPRPSPRCSWWTARWHRMPTLPSGTAPTIPASPPSGASAPNPRAPGGPPGGPRMRPPPGAPAPPTPASPPSGASATNQRASRTPRRRSKARGSVAQRTTLLSSRTRSTSETSIRRTWRPDLVWETSLLLDANTVVPSDYRCVDGDPSARGFRGDRRNADAPGAIPRGSAGAETVGGAARGGGRCRETLCSPVPRPSCYSIAPGRESRVRWRLAALYHAGEDLVYPVQCVRRQLGPRRRRVVLDLLGPRRPRGGRRGRRR